MARILLVDDEPYIQALYGDILSRAGHDVVDTAYNGEEALLKYELLDPPPDLVLMDHRMPIKNGLEATREILGLDAKACVLFVSADQTVRDRVASVGAAGFIEKPFNIVKLLETIDTLVATYRAARASK
jgi:two-component system chemotaxis response regulator CheY